MARRTTSAKMEEVEDLESEATPSREMDLAGGLTFATFLALLAGAVIAQYSLGKYCLQGLFAP